MGISDALAYIGGLCVAIYFFVSLLLSSYNRHHYELAVAEVTLRTDHDDVPISRDSYNYFEFLKLGVYEFLTGVLCFELDWPSCRRFRAIMREANFQMDVCNLVSKEHLREKKSALFDGLSAPPSIRVAETFREVREYYMAVLDGQPAYTFYDLWVHKKQ